MAYTPKDGSGSLFKNQNKQSDTHADYNGTIMIGGKEFWLNAWIKEGKKGKFFSLSIGKEKQPQGFKAKGEDEITYSDDGLDDVPF